MSSVKRYKVVYCNDLSDEQYPGLRSSDHFFAIVDTLNGSVFETDSMEPEDASFCRDLKWVPDMMNQYDSEVSQLQRDKTKLFVRCLEIMADHRATAAEYGAIDWKVAFETWEDCKKRLTRESERLFRLARYIKVKYLGE